MTEVEFAIAVLEATVPGIHGGPQQTADVWEALDTLRGAGIDDLTVEQFWLASGQRFPPLRGGLSEGGRQALNALMNKICRDLRVGRTYAKIPTT